MLKTETIPVKFAYDIDVDMYLYADATLSRSLSKVISFPSPEDTLLAELEFSSKENCYKAIVKGVETHVMAKKNAKRSPGLRECKDRFKKATCKLRKNGERGAKIYDETRMLYVDLVRRGTAVKLMPVAYKHKTSNKTKVKIGGSDEASNNR